MSPYLYAFEKYNDLWDLGDEMHAVYYSDIINRIISDNWMTPILLGIW